SATYPRPASACNPVWKAVSSCRFPTVPSATSALLAPAKSTVIAAHALARARARRFLQARWLRRRPRSSCQLCDWVEPDHPHDGNRGRKGAHHDRQHKQTRKQLRRDDDGERTVRGQTVDGGTDPACDQEANARTDPRLIADHVVDVTFRAAHGAQGGELSDVIFGA